MRNLFHIPDAVEIERHRRIILTMAAYAYEFGHDSFMSDAEFDAESLKVQPSISTGNEILDKFFKEKFDPDTGSWIHDHPDLEAVKRKYEQHYAKLAAERCFCRISGDKSLTAGWLVKIN